MAVSRLLSRPAMQRVNSALVATGRERASEEVVVPVVPEEAESDEPSPPEAYRDFFFCRRLEDS